MTVKRGTVNPRLAFRPLRSNYTLHGAATSFVAPPRRNLLRIFLTGVGQERFRPISANQDID